MCHETIPKLNSAHLNYVYKVVCTVVPKQRYCVVVESNIDSRATVEGAGPYPFTCTSIIGTPLEELPQLLFKVAVIMMGFLSPLMKIGKFPMAYI